MNDYVERVINKFPMRISRSDMALNPAGNNISEKGDIKRLGKKETEQFHTSVSRIMFIAKREGPYIHQTAAVLSTRVKEPNDDDQQNLVRMIKYLNVTNIKYLTLSADDLKVIKWYVGRGFVVRPDFKSRAGAIMTTFFSNSTSSLFGFLLVYRQLFNSEKPRVMWTLVLLLNDYHYIKCGLD